MISIINYGVGNLFSLSSSLKYLGLESKITACPDDILNASHIILPGVGAFGNAAKKLNDSGLIPYIKQAAAEKKPLLGICVGMQLLFEDSFEYGHHEGLSLLSGSIVSLEKSLNEKAFLPCHDAATLKVPQMGWNSLLFKRADCPVLKYLKEGDFVYYVHSYYAENCEESIAAYSEYGVNIPGIVQMGNIYGTQFHPEKSGTVGLSVLRAFSEI